MKGQLVNPHIENLEKNLDGLLWTSMPTENTRVGTSHVCA